MREYLLVAKIDILTLSSSSNRIFLLSTDIQEFYELTLLDDNKTIQQKTAETIRIANKWETDGVRREVSDNTISLLI